MKTRPQKKEKIKKFRKVKMISFPSKPHPKCQRPPAVAGVDPNVCYLKRPRPRKNQKYQLLSRNVAEVVHPKYHPHSLQNLKNHLRDKAKRH